MESIYGVNCIKGEVHSLMTILRWSSRWSLKGSFASSSGASEQNTIVTEFSELSDRIKDVYDLGNLNCCTYLQPFCSVVISKSANGPLTSASLNSLSKFALYGFFSSDFPGAKDGINMVAHAIASCIFEETDRESDEIILMKLLELATMTFRSDASELLTVSAAWNMYETCLSIFGQIRSSKVLRSEAESTLRHLTLTMFSRIRTILQSNAAAKIGLDTYVTPSSITSEVKKSYWDTDKDTYTVSDPIGTTIFLIKVLTTLTILLDSKMQSVEHVQLALSLINVALEAGGTHLGQLPPIVDILRGDICRYLLVATQSDDLVIFNLSLRVVFNLFVSIKDHMKVQLEVFLNSVHIRLLQQSKVQQHQSIAKNTPNVISALPGMSSTSDKVLNLWNAREEMILESLLEFANEPLVLQDLYINYDCDVKCTNLYDTIISVLCKKSLPQKLQALQLLDKIIDEDDYLDDLTTAATKPRATRGTSCSSSGHAAPSASFPKVLQLINANKSITDEPAYSENNNQWYHALDGINKLAIDGLLTILRSLARKCRANSKNGKGKSVSGGTGARADMSAHGSTDHTPFASALNLERGISQSSISGRNSTDILPLPMHVQFKSPMPTPMPTRTISVSVPVPLNPMDAVDMWCMGSVDDEDDCLSGDAASEATSNSYNHGIASTGASLRIGENADLLDGAEDAQFLFNARAKTAEMLKERKLKKQRLSLIVEQFNKNPFSKEWIKLSIATNILPAAAVPSSSMDGAGQVSQSPDVSNSSSTSADPKALALFLKQNPGLDKTRVGEYLSRGPAEKYPYVASVLKEYVNTFDFVGASFDDALRTFLGYFRLPGEAQCIDRLMEAFAQKLFHDLGKGNPFATGDAAFILSFSTIMLNTDLHNPNLPDAKRMTKDQFVNNNRNINDGQNLPREYLENLYDCIKETQIKLDVDIAEVSGALDMTSWNNLISKNSALQAPPVFTPAVTARRSSNESDGQFYSLGNVYQKDMFLVLAKPLLNTLLVVLERCYLDDVYIVRIIEGLLDFCILCESLQLESLLDRLLIALYSSIKRIMEHRDLKEKRDKAQYGVTSFAVDDLLSEKEFSTLKSLLEYDIPHIVDVSNDTRSTSLMQSYTSNSTSMKIAASSSNQKGSVTKNKSNDGLGAANGATTSASFPDGSTPSKSSSASTADTSATVSPSASSGNLRSRNAEEMSLEQLQIQQMLIKSNKEKLRYIGSVQIRSEMILKLLLHCGQKYASSITHNGWQVIFAALLWLRGKGLLGESARLSQIYQLGYAFNDSSNRSGGRGSNHNKTGSKGGTHEQSIDDYHSYYYSNSYNSSVFEQSCHKAAMGLRLKNILTDFENDKNALTASKIVRGEQMSGRGSAGSGVLGNIWSMFSGQDEGKDDSVSDHDAIDAGNSNSSGGNHSGGGGLSIFSDDVDMDQYISHFTWNSSVLFCARNVDSIINAYRPRMWDSYCFMKHTMQYHDIIALSYEHPQVEDESSIGTTGGSGRTVTAKAPASSSTNMTVMNSDIVLLKTKDIGVSNSLFVCLMYLIRSIVVELTEYQYNVGNDGVSQGFENKIDRSVSVDSDLSGTTSPDSLSSSGTVMGSGRKKPTKQAICAKQLDACFLLDLGFRVMVSNMYGYAAKSQFDTEGACAGDLLMLTGMYRRLVGLFDLILDEHLEMFCTHYPYVVERVSLLLLDLTVVAATSLSITMMPPSKNEAPEAPNVSTAELQSHSESQGGLRALKIPFSPQSPTRSGNKLPQSFSIADILWYSLEVLRNISPNVLMHTGHLVGKGISSFVLSCCSTGAIEHFTLQNWCILFHIFSATASSCPGIGRQYVWDTLCHLVDNHHINTMNFSSCRHLLLKYLHNVFPSGGESAEGLARLALSHSVVPESTDGGDGGNLHLVQAMVRVTKLAMMSLAGSDDKDMEASNRFKGQNATEEMLVTFPCPVLSMAYLTSVMAGNSGSKAQEGGQEYANYYKFISLFVGNEEHYPDVEVNSNGSDSSVISARLSKIALTQPHVQIKPLRFHRAEEVEVLWIETAKLLADVVLLLKEDISEQAIYCLQALFIAGRTVSPLSWVTVLGELTSRLPLNLNMFAVRTPPVTTEGSGTQSQSRTDELQSLAEYKANDTLRSQMVSVALHGCNVIFEAMIEHFEMLMKCDSNLFVPIWAKFVVLLATNSAALQNMPGSHHWANISEIFDMIGNLLRLFSKTVKAANAQADSSTMDKNLSEVDRDHMGRVLTHTWTSCVTLHPALVSNLHQNYPSLVKELLPLCPPDLQKQIANSPPPTPTPKNAWVRVMPPVVAAIGSTAPMVPVAPIADAPTQAPAAIGSTAPMVPVAPIADAPTQAPAAISESVVEETTVTLTVPNDSTVAVDPMTAASTVAVDPMSAASTVAVDPMSAASTVAVDPMTAASTLPAATAVMKEDAPTPGTPVSLPSSSASALVSNMLGPTSPVLDDHLMNSIDTSDSTSDSTRSSASVEHAYATVFVPSTTRAVAVEDAAIMTAPDKSLKPPSSQASTQGPIQALFQTPTQTDPQAPVQVQTQNTTTAANNSIRSTSSAVTTATSTGAADDTVRGVTASGTTTTASTASTPSRAHNRMATYENKKFMNFRKSFVV